jgi:hypothetical protein
MYVDRTHQYFHYFRRAEKCAMMKIEIAIENGQSLKLRQMHAIVFKSSTASTKLITTNEQMTSQWAGGPRGVEVGREGGGQDR